MDINQNETFSEVYNILISKSNGIVSSSTLKGMRMAYNILEKFHSSKFSDISAQDVIDVLNSKDISQSGKMHVKALINKMCAMQNEKGIYTYNIAQDITVSRIKKKDYALISSTQVNELLNRFILETDLHVKEEIAYLLLMLYTELRVAFLVNIKIKDIDLDNYILHSNKDYSGRILKCDTILPQKIYGVLDFLCINKSTEDYLVLGNKRADYKSILLNEFAKKYFNDNTVTTSTLNNTFFNQVKKCGVDLPKVYKKYTKLQEGNKNLKYTLEDLKVEINKIRY